MGVNNFFRQTGKDDTIEPAYMKMMSVPNDGGGTTDVTAADFNALKTRVSNVENKASQSAANISALQSRTSTLETSQTQQNNRLDDLEASQVVQNNRLDDLESSQSTQDERLDTAEEDIEDIKSQLNSIGTTTTIVNYVSSAIGRDIPVSVKDDPELLEAWLKEQDEDGIDLDSLSKRIKQIEENIISDEDIESLVNG